MRTQMGRKESDTRFLPGARDVAPEITERLEYFRLCPEDLETLRNLGSAFDRYLDEFVEVFYGHLLSFPETARFLKDPALVRRLRESQKGYFRSLFQGEITHSTVEHRHQIGLKHAEVGLAPTWFLGAYAIYLDFCLDRLANENSMPRPAANLIRSLVKLILFDISLTLDAYFNQATNQLRFALELVQRSNTELKEFARLVSHDIRTPLATILGLCEETLDEYGEQLPEGALELIKETQAQTRRLARLVHELTAIGQASGDLAARENVSPGRLLEEVVDRLRLEIEQRNITVQIEEPLPRVCTHPGRFREIFYQLLSNAVKFSTGPNPVIRIYATPGEKFHIFHVQDNGPGISPEYHDLIFLPFWRMPAHRESPGSGLGLYFVRTMVEAQGGRVEVTSEPGQGTCFSIHLPAANEVCCSRESAQQDR